MFTSRAWIITSGLVGAISLMLRSAMNFFITGAYFSLPTVNSLFIISGIIFALAASASLFGHRHDSPATEHHHEYDVHKHYEHDDHHHHDFDRSSKNSGSYGVHEEEKLPVTSETAGSNSVYRPVTSSEVTVPEGIRLRRPPTAPLIFSEGDENDTMEDMWKRVKEEKQPKKPNTSQQSKAIARKDSKISTFSCPSPSRARRPPLMGRIPTWEKLKKELSMGRDELNSRVEAFIRKFNDEMKLQRLESLNHNKLFRRPNHL